VALFCGFLVLAPGAPGQKPAEKLEALSQQLQLTPEQKVKLLPVLEQEGPKIEAIKKDTDRDNFMAAADAVSYGLIDKILESRVEIPGTVPGKS